MRNDLLRRLTFGTALGLVALHQAAATVTPGRAVDARMHLQHRDQSQVLDVRVLSVSAEPQLHVAIYRDPQTGAYLWEANPATGPLPSSAQLAEDPAPRPYFHAGGGWVASFMIAKRTMFVQASHDRASSMNTAERKVRAELRRQPSSWNEPAHRTKAIQLDGVLPDSFFYVEGMDRSPDATITRIIRARDGWTITLRGPNGDVATARISDNRALLGGSVDVFKPRFDRRARPDVLFGGLIDQWNGPPLQTEYQLRLVYTGGEVVDRDVLVTFDAKDHGYLWIPFEHEKHHPGEVPPRPYDYLYASGGRTAAVVIRENSTLGMRASEATASSPEAAADGVQKAIKDNPALARDLDRVWTTIKMTEPLSGKPVVEAMTFTDNHWTIVIRDRKGQVRIDVSPDYRVLAQRRLP